MREILFRGKRIDNGEFVEGFYHFSNWYMPPSMKIVDTHYYILPIGGGDAFQIDPDTVGQFTGLTDKDGKRIWEGDIIQYDDGDTAYVGIIRFGEYQEFNIGFNIEWVSPDAKGMFRRDIRFWTACREIGVVDNIHDCPW